MMRAGLIAALIAGPAGAETVMIAGSAVTLRPSAAAGALAEVQFDNHPSNAPVDNGARTLALGGLRVGLTFTFNAVADRDRVVLEPPEGVICVPGCDMTLPEGESAVVRLYDQHAVGM